MKKTFANPDSAEREYTRAMVRYARSIARDVNAILIPALPRIKAEYDAAARVDTNRSDGWADTLDALIADILRLALASGRVVIEKLPSQFVMVSTFNEVQFRAVFKANTGLDLPELVPGAPRSLLGVNVFRDEPFLAPLAEGWIKENTALIVDVPEKELKDIEGVVRRGVMNGRSVRDLAKDVKAKYPMTERRAKLIAQDQTLSLHADLTRNRLQSVGVKEYIWRSVQDSRVRPEHAEYNGNTYSWDKPPVDGHPGQSVRCRCRSEAVWPEDNVATEQKNKPSSPVVESVKEKPSHEKAFESIVAYKRKPEVKASSDRFTEAVAAFNKAKMDWTKSARTYGSAEHAAVVAAQTEAVAAQDMWLAMKNNEVAEAISLLEVPVSQRASPTSLINGVPPKSIAKKAREAASIVSRLIHKDIAPQVSFANTRGRAFYVNGTRTANLSGKSDVKVFCHEMVHDIEYQHPEISNATKAYVEKRAEGQSLRKLRDITGSKSYGPLEVAYEDHWDKRGGSHYTGKVYAGKPSTEVLTMGIERMISDPVGFAEKDPDYLKFLLRIFHNAKD